LFKTILSYKRLHFAFIGRYDYAHERATLVPYQAMLFPDPEQPAEECISKQLEAVAATISNSTGVDWLYLMTESVVPGLLK
jgi:hypothetical protein